MKLASLLVTSVLLAPAIGHAQASRPDPKELKPNCEKSCVVTVTVPSGCGSGIDVSPDPLVVGRGQTVEIQWKVVGDWKFAEDGIYVHKSDGAFERGKAPVATSFVLKNVNKKSASYKYDVNLVGKDGAKCSRDPTVVNH